MGTGSIISPNKSKQIQAILIGFAWLGLGLLGLAWAGDREEFGGRRQISLPPLVVHEREIRFVARAALALPPPDLPPLAGVDRREAGVAHGVERDLGDIEPARARHRLGSRQL